MTYKTLRHVTCTLLCSGEVGGLDEQSLKNLGNSIREYDHSYIAYLGLNEKKGQKLIKETYLRLKEDRKAAVI